MKKIIDITLSTFILLLTSPLLICIAFAIRIQMGSPILFRQTRPGLYGMPFEMLKFRTMKNSYDENGRLLEDADRLTTLGRFLRSTSLDELPELLNVIKGEMSLVGPRPLLMEYLPLYSAEQRRRHDVKPGVTGWAQINGRNALSWKQKFSYDIWYVDNRSIFLDFKILLLTIIKVMRREGISSANHATTSLFTGNDIDDI